MREREGMEDGGEGEREWEGRDRTWDVTREGKGRRGGKGGGGATASKLQFLAPPLVAIFVLGLVCLVLASGSILRVFFILHNTSLPSPPLPPLSPSP